MPDYELTTNDRTYPVSAAELDELDLIPAGPTDYHLLRAGRGYRIELRGLDVAARTVTLAVDGREFTYTVADETDLAIARLGFSNAASEADRNVHAPMPGLVFDLLVEVGQEVAEGEALVILEAMKMENVLRAAGAGRVTAVHVARGEAVEKRQLLLEIE